MTYLSSSSYSCWQHENICMGWYEMMGNTTLLLYICKIRITIVIIKNIMAQFKLMNLRTVGLQASTSWLPPSLQIIWSYGRLAFLMESSRIWWPHMLAQLGTWNSFSNPTNFLDRRNPSTDPTSTLSTTAMLWTAAWKQNEEQF